MKISRIKIKNLFGIREYDAVPGHMELSGKNGVGKTSVIDAVRLALTNKSGRDYTVRNGEAEGEILVETDTGISISRKVRTQQADYKSIKQNGREVPSPEAFLHGIFTELQLNPIEFLSMDRKKQNAIILDMIQYDWDMGKIKEWFGEIPGFVNYEQNILSVLNDIQAESGDYFKARQDINRDIRNKKAFVEEIAATIPAGYDAEHWESANAGEIYRKIGTIRNENAEIERARLGLDGRNSHIRKLEADREIGMSIIDREFASRHEALLVEQERLNEQMKANAKELESLGEKKADRQKLEEQKHLTAVANYEKELGELSKYAGKAPTDTKELTEEAENIERMKAHINEYRRMVSLQDEIAVLVEESETLTNRIEKARTLPGEILADCTIPVDGLTVENGIPLIHGLPVSNLSDGQKLDLCVDVATQNPGGLQIVLIDGVEKLSTDLREKLYHKCMDKGIQFIATRTTDDNELTVVELGEKS